MIVYSIVSAIVGAVLFVVAMAIPAGLAKFALLVAAAVCVALFFALAVQGSVGRGRG